MPTPLSSREGCCACGWRGSERELDANDVCPRCKQRGTMTTYYGDDERRVDELTLEERRALGFPELEVVITDWTDVDGFVHVDGKRVPGASGVDRVKVQSSFNAPCLHCHNLNIPVPLVLWKRFEHALAREMYWFAVPPGAYERRPRYCAPCTALIESRRD
jgi:hypothetical protein